MNTPYDCFNSENTQEDQANQVKINQFSYFPNKVIGYGSFGCVFEGRNNETNEQVAVKVIQLKKINSTVQKQLLQNEKKLIKQLVGLELKGVIKYFEVIQLPTQIYIVMEYCPGGDLENIIKKKQLTQEDIKIYISMLIQGLINLFQLNIVHRDLKPSNVLVDQNGNLKIADFGFAVIQNQQTKKYNYCVGSPAYCSPEVLKNCEFGQKSDIWALGVTLYKMLTNKTPWKSKSQKQLLQTIRQNPISQSSLESSNAYLVSLVKSFCCYELSQRCGLAKLEEIKDTLSKQIYNEENGLCKKLKNDHNLSTTLSEDEEASKGCTSKNGNENCFGVLELV